MAPRKSAKQAPDKLQTYLRQISESNQRYFELYPSMPARLRAILTGNDPIVRERLAAARTAIAKRGASESADVAAHYGLTPAQAKLASYVAEHGTIAGYAEKARLSPLTVRTHLKAIFTKTGVTRQSELMRLMSSRKPF